MSPLLEYKEIEGEINIGLVVVTNFVFILIYESISRIGVVNKP